MTTEPPHQPPPRRISLELTSSDEYREAGENFRRGFSLIFDSVRLFVLVTTLLFAILSYVQSNKSTFGNDASSGGLATFSVITLGIITCIAAMVSHYRMRIYLRIFLEKAKDIEAAHADMVHDERLRLSHYQRIYSEEIKGRDTYFNNFNIPMIAYFIVLLLWFLLALHFSGVDRIPAL